MDEVRPEVLEFLFFCAANLSLYLFVALYFLRRQDLLANTRHKGLDHHRKTGIGSFLSLSGSVAQAFVEDSSLDLHEKIRVSYRRCKIICPSPKCILLRRLSTSATTPRHYAPGTATDKFHCGIYQATARSALIRLHKAFEEIQDGPHIPANKYSVRQGPGLIPVQTIDIREKIVEDKYALLFELELGCSNAFSKIGSPYVTPKGLFRFRIDAKDVLEWV